MNGTAYGSQNMTNNQVGHTAAGVSKAFLRRIAIVLCGLSTSLPAYSAGYTPWAEVTEIERVGDGIVIRGSFGDVNNCGTADIVYYPKTHEDYELVLSMALTALTADREMRFYIDTCVSISFHWGSNNPVINQSRNGQAIYIR